MEVPRGYWHPGLYWLAYPGSYWVFTSPAISLPGAILGFQYCIYRRFAFGLKHLNKLFSMPELKILYGVQGTGNGHISRARMMAKHFTRQNADVTYLFSGRDPEHYFAMDDFGDYQHRRGLTFTTEAGKVNYLKTVRDNNIFQFFNDVRNLDVSAYDLVISDFEPVTAWAAKLAKKSEHRYRASICLRLQRTKTRSKSSNTTGHEILRTNTMPTGFTLA